MISVSVMRSLDRWIGVPACVLLTGIRRISNCFIRQPKDGTLNKILFIKLAEQGATVAAYPAIQRVIEKVGRDNVYFLVFEDNRFILDALKVIPPENVLTISTGGPISLLLDTLRVVGRIRRLRFDAAVDMEFFARSSAILSFLSRAPRRVGFHAFGEEGPYRGDLMTHRLRFNPYLHSSQIFLMTVGALDIPADELPTFNMMPPAVNNEQLPRFRPSREKIDKVREILKVSSGTEEFQPLILMNPNCSDIVPLRRWPLERYVELAKRLIERYPRLYVAMTGSPSEKSQVAGLVGQVGSDRCFSLAGKTTLEQLLIVYDFASVMVTNDSGPAHFAALTDIEILTLFGPVYPKMWSSLTSRQHVIWENLMCSPCMSVLNNRTSACRNNVCMQRIDVERVFEKVCNLFETRTNS